MSEIEDSYDEPGHDARGESIQRRSGGQTGAASTHQPAEQYRRVANPDV